MSLVLKAILAAVVAIAIFVVYKQFEVPDKIPELEDKWWGKEPKTNEIRKPTRAYIDIPQDVIADLNYRLQHTKPFHPSLEGVNQRYGIHTTVLNNVLQYWTTQYNWTERQTFLNQYPHYFLHIRGLRIHFMHIKPQRTVTEDGKTVKVLPLLMAHGWPGSIREFYEIIPKLTQPRNDKDFVFELIIPSLPGFAFSEGSTKPGLSAIYMAQIFAELMEALNFDRYYLQGGDWGSNVVQKLAVLFPERVIGLHCNMCIVNTALSNLKFFIGKYFPSLIYQDDEVKLCNSTANSLKFLIEETGYFHLQATKPDTVGVALRESPMGLAAYILEKFITLTQADFRDLEDGGLTRKFTLEQLLDNVMIYWVTETMTSAMRIYAEAITNYELESKSVLNVPTGCTRFPNEIVLSPRSILVDRFRNLVHLTQHERGGHFAALEEPDLLAYDVYKFVETVQRLND